MGETSRSVPSIVVITHGGTSVVTHEMVFLVVATAEEFECTRVRVVAHCLKDHIVTLLHSEESDILHSLNERQSSAIGSLSFLLKVHSEGRLVIDVVATPEAHGDGPEEDELGRATPDVGHLVEKLRATILIEVSVAEHG